MERRRSRLPASDRRQQILDTAEELFVTRGFEAVTMRDIAAAAGVARPTVYAYFPDTEAILDALFDAVASRVWDRVQPLVARREGPPDAETFAAIFIAMTQEKAALAILRSGGSPIFQSRRRAVFDARLADAVRPHAVPGSPHIGTMVGVLLEGMAYWAVSHGVAETEMLAREVAAFIENGLAGGGSAVSVAPLERDSV